MNPVLRLGFADTIEPVKDFFTEVLSNDFLIVRDDQNPEYLIFGDRNFGETNKAFNGTNTIKIFYTGENQRPWDYDCHYAIGFDHFDNERHYRLPLYVLYDWDNRRKGIKKEPVKLNYEDRKFCSFVVKNGNCTKRNEFFYKLNSFLKVDSGGPLFNNIGYVLPSGDRAVQEKLAFLPNYRFNLCFENASYPGYATEKLYEAFLGNTVPIYWGSPTIFLDFNSDAFLSWHNFKDDEMFLKEIQYVNQSKSTWEYMVQQPMWKTNPYMDMEQLRLWFRNNIFKG